MDYNVTVKPTPVSPWYKLYEWEGDQKSVLITVDTIPKKGLRVCALLSLQNAIVRFLLMFINNFFLPKISLQKV